MFLKKNFKKAQLFSYTDDQDIALLEAVVFAFYKDGKYLIESNRVSDGKTFFLSGKIDKEDRIKCLKDDYKIYALKREVSEELQGQVTFDEYDFLGSLDADIGIRYYVYLIQEYKGKMPTQTIEEGKKHADLEWMIPKDAKNLFTFNTAFQISDMIENFVNNTSRLSPML